MMKQHFVNGNLEGDG